MRKTILVTLIFCIFQISQGISPYQTFYLQNEEIEVSIKFKKYGFQSIFSVPNVVTYRNNQNVLLSYRTEFHNGTENGCMIVLNIVNGKVLKPILVLEELFYISEEEYYFRKIREVNDKSILFDVIKNTDNNQEILLTVELFQDQGRFEVKRIIEHIEGYAESIYAFSDVYDTVKNKILSNDY